MDGRCIITINAIDRTLPRICTHSDASFPVSNSKACARGAPEHAATPTLLPYFPFRASSLSRPSLTRRINCAAMRARSTTAISESEAKMTENEADTKQGKIDCPSTELNLGITLKGGQSFRWFSHNDGYRGVFKGRVWTLGQNDTHVYYTAQGPSVDSDDCDRILREYFRLDVCLKDLCEEWAESDPHFKASLSKTCGVRILNQDVVENVFSFICTSNNNIKRISGMVEKLCGLFGEKICSIEGKDYYDFPTIEALTEEGVEEELKKEKFGYRAGYIVKTARRLMELGGRTWLSSLHKRNSMLYTMAREKLATLPGIGPKVADCVCLMSLGHLEAIPVDTHIFQVARANYLPHLERQKTVTPKIHKEVSNHLRELWGPLAGWAQAIVFCAKINANTESSVEHDTAESNFKRSKTDSYANKRFRDTSES